MLAISTVPYIVCVCVCVCVWASRTELGDLRLTEYETPTYAQPHIHVCVVGWFRVEDSFSGYEVTFSLITFILKRT